MSDEAVDGALFVIGDKVCFIPREDLRSYRLPDDAAAAARQQLDPQLAEVSGYAAELNVGMVFGVQYSIRRPGDPSPNVEPSGIGSHCLTVIKEVR